MRIAFRWLRIPALLLTVGSVTFLLASAWVARPTSWERAPAVLPTEAAPSEPVPPARSLLERRGIYLTANVAGDTARLEPLVRRSREAGFNALVIDVKDNTGTLGYPSRLAQAQRLGAVVPRYDLEALVARLHAVGLVFIARLVVFYDPLLAASLGREGPWVLPSDPEVVAYNLAVAEEVAALGVDEIQFDYIRFPDDAPLGEPYPERVAAVTAFLAQAHARLGGRVALSADVYGRTLWNWNAQGTDPTGQLLERLAPFVDVLSPMIYPSHYEPYFWGRPYEVVRRSLSAGLERGLRLRPFLQAFELRIPAQMSAIDYVRAQRRAVVELGVEGYLFWNPRGKYELLWQALALP